LCLRERNNGGRGGDREHFVRNQLLRMNQN
jgi:hypothetical protein